MTITAGQPIAAADVLAAIPAPATASPGMDGTAGVGASAYYARQDHIHPTDTSRYAASNPANYQTATQVSATLTGLLPVASNNTPIMDGSATVGSSSFYARADHAHPTDTSRYAASNPSGYQTAAQVTTTVTGLLPAAGSATPLAGGTAVPGTSTAYARQDHVHPAAAGLSAADLASTTDNTKGAALVGYLSIASGSRGRTLSAKLSETVSVVDFGADPIGVLDSTAAFNNAIAASSNVTIPAGTFKIAGTITNNGGSLKNFSLCGGGIGVTTLTSTSTTLPIISLINVTGYAKLSGFTLTRSVTPVSGADNLTTNASGIGTAQSIALDNIESMNGWNGFFLGNASFSSAEWCYAHDNYRSGFRLDNGTFGTTLQWNLINCLSEANGTFGATPTGSGFEVTTTGSGLVTLDTWVYCTTFANMGPGASFIWNGTASINDIILQDCFFGSDGYSEVFAQTGGFSHSMLNCRVELAGGIAGQTQGRGATAGTGHAPTITGNGVELASSEKDWQIANCYISGSAYNGILTAAAGVTQITGCNIRVNSQASSTTYNGVSAGAGHGPVVVSGCVIGNTSGPPTNFQQNGIAVNQGNLLIATGNDLGYNPGSIAATNNPNLVQAGSNIGYNGRKSGAFAVPNATLAQTITHAMLNGISGTLTPIVIQATLDGGTAGTTFIISAITSTTFTITFSASASGQTVFWTAIAGNYQ